MNEIIFLPGNSKLRLPEEHLQFLESPDSNSSNLKKWLHVVNLLPALPIKYRTFSVRNSVCLYVNDGSNRKYFFKLIINSLKLEGETFGKCLHRLTVSAN